MSGLVLSRKKDERIFIGEGPNRITLLVVEIRGDKVRLHIDAPRDVPVHREEVFEAIQREKLPVAEAATNEPCGLAGAGYETKRVKQQTNQWLDSHKQQPPEDDQALLDKMEDEQRV